MSKHFDDVTKAGFESVSGLVDLFERVAQGEVFEVNKMLQKKVKWNDCSIHLCEAALAHGRSFVISQFHIGIENSSLTHQLKKILTDLFQLLALSWILEDPSKFLRFSSLNFSDIDCFTFRRNNLLTSIRPFAIPLVDAFDFRDEVLSSTLGCWDGWVYHRLFQAAVNTPLNRETQNSGVLWKEIQKSKL